MTIDDLEAIDPWDENYGLHIVLTGVLINKTVNSIWSALKA